MILGNFIIMFIGVIMILFGILSVFSSTMEWLIRMRNVFTGTQTKITKGTVIIYRISGALFILIGLFVIFTGLSLG